MNVPSSNGKTKGSFWARQILAAAALAAVAIVAGCSEHHHEYREVVYESAPPPQMPVEQPVEVVYEPAPPEIVDVYEPTLSPYGHWVNIAPYGRCWVYDHRPEGWRPYTIGHWVATDQGWVWVAEGDEVAFGETCYHYGRWYLDPNEGWVWVPGRVWGPSWVAWREGGGYSCWAPLPPQCGDGYPINAVVCDRYVQPAQYVCVRTEDLTVVNIREHITVNNITIVNNARNITNINYVNNRAVNRGVPVREVEAATGRKIRVTRTTQVHDVAEARRLIAEGKPVAYIPPAVASYSKAHPVGKHPPRASEETAKGPHETGEEAGRLQEEKDARERSNSVVKPEGENAKLDRADQDRTTQGKTDAQRMADERAASEKAKLEEKDSERAAKEKAEQDKKDAERSALAKTEQDKKDAEMAAKDKAAADRKAAEEKAAQEKAAAEEKASMERVEKEKAAEEKAAALQAAKERAAAEKEAKLKAAQEKAAADKAARENKGNQNPNDPNNPNQKKRPKQPGDNNSPPQ